MARTLIGTKILDRRRALGTTQLALPRHLDISAVALSRNDRAQDLLTGLAHDVGDDEQGIQ